MISVSKVTAGQPNQSTRRGSNPLGALRAEPGAAFLKQYAFHGLYSFAVVRLHTGPAAENCSKNRWGVEKETQWLPPGRNNNTAHRSWTGLAKGERKRTLRKPPREHIAEWVGRQRFYCPQFPVIPGGTSEDGVVAERIRPSPTAEASQTGKRAVDHTKRKSKGEYATSNVLRGNMWSGNAMPSVQPYLWRRTCIFRPFCLSGVCVVEKSLHLVSF